MALFHGIDPVDGDGSVKNAAKVVEDALTGLQKPRSLCEMRLQPDDYEWLLQWAWKLSPRTCQHFLDWSRGARTLGTLLLLVVSETARRDAQEGHIWSSIRPKLNLSTRGFLFRQGQPIQPLKDAIELACRHLSLRHLFGIAGVQSYYDSIYLQFGFTHKGIARLPYWLAGQGITEAIAHLLSPELGSDSFQLLWFMLKEYRRNNVTKQRLRNVIAESPWLLPEWSDEIIQRSQDRLDLGTSAGIQAGVPEEFLDVPVLRWEPPSEPYFTSRLINLALLDLSSSRYSIRVGGKEVGSLWRQPSGTYRHDDEVQLPCTSPRLTVSIEDEMGSVKVATEIELWDAEEDICVFELSSGRKIDCWKDRMSTTRSYAVLTTSDLKLRPTLVLWRLINASEHKLSILAKDWTSLEVLLENEVLWFPYRATAPSRPRDPDWATAITIRVQPHDARIGQSVTLELSGIPVNCDLVSIRVGTMPLLFYRKGSGFRTESFEMTSAVANKPTVSLALRHNGRLVRLRRHVLLETSGIARLTKNGWMAVTPEELLTTNDGGNTLYRIFLPSHWIGEEFNELALVEGSIFSRRLSRSARPLGSLGGFGAPLAVRKGPYNSVGDVLLISSRVVDPGIVQGVECTNAEIRITLRHSIEPDNNHSVCLWYFPDEPVFISGGALGGSASTWTLRNARNAATAESIIAIAYSGTRIGAWWPQQLPSPSTNSSDSSLPAAHVAALLRWMHLPLLDTAFKETLTAWIRHYPVDFLAAWLLEQSLSKDLNASPVSEEWLSVVRQYFSNWEPTETQAKAFIALFDSRPPHPLIHATQALLRADPVLMARLLRQILPTGKTARRNYILTLREAVAGFPQNLSAVQSENRMNQLLDEAARLMQVNSGFVELGLVRPAIKSIHGVTVSGSHRRNLDIAMGVAAFREYLAVRILQAFL